MATFGYTIRAMADGRKLRRRVSGFPKTGQVRRRVISHLFQDKFMGIYGNSFQVVISLSKMGNRAITLVGGNTASTVLLPTFESVVVADLGQFSSRQSNA